MGRRDVVVGRRRRESRAGWYGVRAQAAGWGAGSGVLGRGSVMGRCGGGRGCVCGWGWGREAGGGVFQ